MTTLNRLDTMLAYYAAPGVMTEASAWLPQLRALPDDLPSLVKTVQGLMLHVFWAERYGVKLSEERKNEVQIRPMRRKLPRLFEVDPRPLSEARPPELRLVGNCRDFSVFLTALLQARGIPARARCGFGTYFLPGHFEDHWRVEYWQEDAALPDGGRWVRVDAQLDAFQCAELGVTFDPLDMPDGPFITGGLAWQMCRRGEANPDDFGIFDYHGWDFVKNDLLLDLRALNKVELLPWDICGLATVAYTDLTPQQFDLLDAAAALTLAGPASFSEVRGFYEENVSLHPPVELLR